MRRYFRLIRVFIALSAQEEIAYRANFLVSALHSLLNFGTGLLGLVVLFDQVEAVHGWDYASTLAVLGVYLSVSALRGLFISPSLDSLVGMDGDIWRGEFDFTLIRPANTQFLASFRRWRLFALVDLALGLLVLGAALVQLNTALTGAQVITFLLTLCASVMVLYAVLLVFASLVFWNPGFLFTWVFDGLFQMARYPVGMYPGGLRLALTWIVPVGIITTVPARALTHDLPPGLLVGALVFAGTAVLIASILFRAGLGRYASASS
ncbi:MAG: ABC-2 family transporter protein [Anaerolineae bacterium]|nr:ABC-2 family transporter protein [Anaerolineae bacterium]